MRIIRQVIKLFFLLTMVFSLNEGYSQKFLASKYKKVIGSGTGGCNICESAESYDITFSYLPNQFPFKIDQISLIDSSTLGFNITMSEFNKMDTLFSILAPNSNKLIPNQTIHSNSHLLNSNGVITYTLRLISTFCIDSEPKLISSDGFIINSIFRIHHYDFSSRFILSTQTLSHKIVMGILYNCDGTLPYKNITSQNSPSGYLFQWDSPKTLSHKNEIFSPNTISLFPNPSKDVINLVFSSEKKEKIEIIMYDSQGKKLQIPGLPTFSSKGENILKINIKNYPSGIYYLKLNTQSNAYIFKTIKI